MCIRDRVYAGCKFVPDLEPWILDQTVRMARYALVALTAIGLAPWIFVKLKLAESGLKRES